MPVTMCRRGGDTGSVTMELAVLAPGLLLVIGLIIGAGRIALAGQTVQQAADEAARAVSLQRSPAAGIAAGRETAARVLEGQGLDCQPSAVSVSAGGLAAATGQTGAVSVTVSCTIRLGSLAPGFPGAKTMSATGSYAIDTFTVRG